MSFTLTTFLSFLRFVRIFKVLYLQRHYRYFFNISKLVLGLIDLLIDLYAEMCCVVLARRIKCFDCWPCSCRFV
jgi:hypothetical protein